MSKRSEKLYLADILESIKKIEAYTKNLSFEDFLKNELVMDAIARNLEIIGEAARSIPEKTKEKYPEVSWYKTAGMRNKIVHEYFGVDEKIIWDTVKNNLPELKKQIKKICKRF